jgi:hypothetical protein
MRNQCGSRSCAVRLLSNPTPYEAGWGPMMSETAFFVKDVIGPPGAVSIQNIHSIVAPNRRQLAVAGMTSGSNDRWIDNF